ncbi:MAG: DedA family protein [Candidatus Eisenbacteria bacterium]|nr:DedA family protein [Candidatus Eisenbacteria bacterium]
MVHRSWQACSAEGAIVTDIESRVATGRRRLDRATLLAAIAGEGDRARNTRAWILAASVPVLVGLFFLLRTKFSLLALFLYTIAANSFIPFPHEPAVLYYGATYPALTVALICGAATCISAILDYTVLGTAFMHRKAVEIKRDSRLYKAAVHYFNQTPFWTMVFAGFTPVPFYPFRVIGIACGYPRWKYVLSICVGRTPRYYLLAWFGNQYTIPAEVLILLFVGMFLPPVIRLLCARAATRELS